MTLKGEGSVHVYTGNGKGKTTAAFGLAMRAAGRGMTVLIIQFLKHHPDAGEIVSAKKLHGVRVEQYGKDELVTKEKLTKEDMELAKRAFDRAKTAVAGSEADLIVLDEINVAVHFDLIPLKELVKMISSKPAKVELVLTGRYADPAIIANADYVTEMLLTKHPFEKGQMARPGIEY